MGDPFHIDGPALVSFSGGRTSAYMLWRILQAHGGTLPDDVKVCFANTGKEMPQTLDFVRDCGERWSVEVVWLEYRNIDGQHTYATVCYETASRNGEPYNAILAARPMLPNPGARYCTQELKVRVMKKYARSLGWEEWTNVLGLRADEPRRVANARRPTGQRWENSVPLAIGGIAKSDVVGFWSQQNFDLMLPNINGTTPLGNCDLCFLKSAAALMGIMRDRPDLAAWWIDAERDQRSRANKPNGALFREDRLSYAAMLDAVQRQQNFDFGSLDERQECFCHD